MLNSVLNLPKQTFFNPNIDLYDRLYIANFLIQGLTKVISKLPATGNDGNTFEYIF